MNRLEKFRYIRNGRRRYRLAIILSFLIMFSGIYIADNSINSLMNKKSGPGMVSIRPYGDNYYYIKLLNEDVYINVKYIKEDVKRFNNWLSRVLKG